MAKSVAVLWACFLVAGPFFEDMKWWLSLVSTIITDAGTEKHTVEMPDVLRAFLLWNSGAVLETCAALVSHAEFLFPNAMRIYGWSHLWSNLMSCVAEVCPSWEAIKNDMRTLVPFWRNRSWRKWVKVALRGTDVDPRLFVAFTASMAKWRFETIPDSQRQLLRLRDVHEKHLKEEMFADVQEKETMKRVLAAAKNKEFWIFTEASYSHVFARCEGARRWGLTCNCPEHIRARREEGKKRIECYKNSRKLCQAYDFLASVKQDLFDKGCSLTIEECGGHNDIWMCVKTMLWKAMTGIDQRFGHLNRLPHVVARCGTVEGATEFMTQLRAREWGKHDYLTRRLADRVGGDIERRSQGEAVSPALQVVLDEAADRPLNESPGEGYHRATHLEHDRAAASTSRHVKQSTRFKAVLRKTEEFAEEHGERGHAVVRFEFRAWKRILQTSERRYWFPVKMSPEAVYARVYREDDRAREDFSCICSRQPPVLSIDPEDVDGRDALRNEYLVSVTRNSETYSVSESAPAEPAAGGDPAPENATRFVLLEKAYGNRRPDFMSVADPGADVALQASLAMLVVFLTPRPRELGDAGVVANDQHILHALSAPVWMRPHEICSADAWYKNLYKWSPEPTREQPGAIVLAKPALVFNRKPYLDPTCPTICIAWKLKREGWAPTSRQCIHNAVDVGNFDSYPAVRMKPYYQVVLSLPKCLPLTSSIPSRQPIKFFQLLLAGQRVEPGLGNSR